MKASDIAYLATLVEKAPSNYPGKADLLQELQEIYRRTQSGRFGPGCRVPVMPEIGIIDVERG